MYSIIALIGINTSPPCICYKTPQTSDLKFVSIMEIEVASRCFSVERPTGANLRYQFLSRLSAVSEE